jgi:hypothetical protein
VDTPETLWEDAVKKMKVPEWKTTVQDKTQLKGVVELTETLHES